MILTLYARDGQLLCNTTGCGCCANFGDTVSRMDLENYIKELEIKLKAASRALTVMTDDFSDEERQSMYEKVLRGEKSDLV